MEDYNDAVRREQREQYECEECGDTFDTRQSLAGHMSRHTGPTDERAAESESKANE